MKKAIKDLTANEIEALCDARNPVKRGNAACAEYPIRWGKQCISCELNDALYLMAAHYGGNNAAQSIVDRFKELATANAAKSTKPDVVAETPRKVVAVDFDGTLCTNKYPNIGEPIQQAIRYIKRERLNGSIVVLWTCRQGAPLASAVDWCERQGLAFDYINENAAHNIAKYGGDTRKIYADVYVDDRAVAFNYLLYGGGQPPKQIRNNFGALEEKGVIFQKDEEEKNE